MNEDCPPQKKRRVSQNQSRSNSPLAEERGQTTASDPSSLPPSRNESRRRLPRFLAASSSRQDLLHSQTSQSSDSGVANISSTIASEQPDQKLVKATLAKAKAGVDGIGLVSGKVENVTSASDHLQSVPDTIDSFSKILKPFEQFHYVATTLANVHPYAKVALSIFTCASKMILD